MDVPTDLRPSLTWYAVKTRARCEKLVAQALQRRKLEVFLPVWREKHRWSDRTKIVEIPLFPGYVLVRYDPSSAGAPSVNVRGVLSLVLQGGKPAPLRSTDVEALLRLDAERVPLEPHKFLKAGQRVRIRSGPFRGIEGTLVSRQGKDRLVMNVELFQQAAALSLDGLDVGPADS